MAETPLFNQKDLSNKENALVKSCKEVNKLVTDLLNQQGLTQTPDAIVVPSEKIVASLIQGMGNSQSKSPKNK